MHSSVLRGCRRRHAARLLAALLLAAGACLAAAACSGPRYEKRGALHCIQDGELLYTYDPVWRVESIHRIDPSTGVEERDEVLPGDELRVEALRLRLLGRLGVASLDGIPREGEAELESLRALGYL